MMKKKLIAGLIAASLFGVAAVGCAKTAPVDNRVKDLFGSYDRGDNIVGDTNAYADPNVTVDGELSEELWTNAVWNDMKSEEANRTGTNVGNNVADCNISATAVVRDNGLYVGIKSADTVAYAGKILAVNDKTILSAFAQTGVSLYFSDTVDLIAGDPCHEIGFSVAGTVRYIFHNAGGRYERNLRNAKIKTKIDGDINTSSINGYTVEVYIPWTELGYAENTYAESIMATFGSHRHPAFENAESYDGKKLTFEMLELQRGASWLKPLTWTEYGENGKTDGGVTESDKYGDYSATLTANAKALYPQSSAFISASGGQQYSYVKNVHGNNLYAEAVVKNVNTNWGFVGFAFRDVQTPPTYTQTGARFTETDNGAVWAGLRYGGGDIGNHLYMISSDLSDVGDVSKTGNKSYAIGVKETYDNSKNSTGVKIGAYISDSGTVLIYVNGELKKTGYAKHLAGKDLCASFAARDASCFYGDITVLTGDAAKEKVKDDLSGLESDVYGDYSETIKADATAVYGANGDLSLNKTNGQQYLYVKNKVGKKLYAKATISNVNVNWGVIGFAFRDPTDLTKSVWMGLRYGAELLTNHCYVISPNLADVGSDKGGNVFVGGTQETFDISKGDTGVTVEAMIDDDGMAIIAINGVVKKYVKLDAFANKDLIMSVAGRDCSATLKNTEFLAANEAAAKIAAYKASAISDIYGDYSETIKADATAIYGANGDLALNKTSGQQYLYVKNKVGKKLYAKATISNVNVNWGVIGFAFRDPTDLTKSVWMGLRYAGADKSLHLYVISTNLDDVGDTSKDGNKTFALGTVETFDNSKGDTGVTVEAMIDDDGTAIIAINGVVKKYVKLDALANKDLIMSVAGANCGAELKNTEYLAANEAAAKVTAYKSTVISDVYGDYSETIKADATAVYGANGDLTLNKTSGQQYLYVKNKVGKKLYAKATISNVNVNWGVIGFAFRDPTDLTKSVWMGLRYGEDLLTNHWYVISPNLADVGSDKGGNVFVGGTQGTFDNSKGDTGVTVEAMIDDDGTAIIAINGEIKKFVKLDALANKDLIMSVAGANCGAELKNTEYLAANEAAAKVTAYKSTVISDVYGDYSETIKADATAIYGANGDLTLNKTSKQQYLYVKNKVGKKLYAKATISNVNVNHGVVGFAFRDPTDLTKSVWIGLRYAGDNKSLHLYVISTNLDDVGDTSKDGNKTYAFGTAETFDNSKGDTGVTLEAYIDESGNVIVGVDGKFVQSARLTAFADKDMIVAIAGRDCAAEYKNVSVKTGEAAFQAINDSYATDGDTFNAKNFDGVYQNGVNLSGDIANAAHPTVEITVPSNGDRYATYKSEINSNKIFAQYTIKSFGTVTSNTWGQVSLAFVNADGKVTYYGVKYQQTTSAATNIAAIASYYTENNQIIAWSDTDKDNGTKGIYHMTYDRAGFPNDSGMLDKFNDKGLTFTVYCDGAKYYYFLNGIPIAGGNKGYNERSIADNTNDFGGVGTSVIVKALIVAQNVHVTFSDYNIAIGDNAATSYNAFLNTLSGDTFTAKNIDGIFQTGVDLRGDIANANHPSVEITVPSNGQRYATYNGVIDSNKIFAQYTIKSLGTKTDNKNGAVSLAFVNADGNVTYYGLQCVQSDNAATQVSRIASYYTQNNKIIAWADPKNTPDITKDVNWMTYANAGFPGDSGMLDNLNGEGLTFTVYCDGTKYHYFLNGVPIAGHHGSYTRSLVTADQNFNTVGTSNIVKALIVVENAHVAFSDYKIAVGDNAATSYNAFLSDIGSEKYGDYSETIKANSTATYGANMVLNKTSKQQYLYVKNMHGNKLYAKATISNVNVSWGFVGFAFRDVQIPPTYNTDVNHTETDNGAVWVGLRYGGTDGNKYTNHLYMISSNLEDVGSDSKSGNYKVNGTQETFDNSKGDTGVTVEAYIDETGKVTLFIDGVKKTEQTISHLAGKDMIVSFACRDARACYRDISIKTGDEATTAFNALTQLAG